MKSIRGRIGTPLKVDGHSGTVRTTRTVIRIMDGKSQFIPEAQRGVERVRNAHGISLVAIRCKHYNETRRVMRQTERERAVASFEQVLAQKKLAPPGRKS